MARPDQAPEELRITSAVDELARLYPWLDAAANRLSLNPNMLQAMHVALEEAVMNVAMHGYPAGEAGEIIVQLQVEANAAVLRVEDQGPRFDPVAAPENAGPDQATPGGHGIKLLRHFCKDISYARRADRNFLTLRFPFKNA